MSFFPFIKSHLHWSYVSKDIATFFIKNGMHENVVNVAKQLLSITLHVANDSPEGAMLRYFGSQSSLESYRRKTSAKTRPSNSSATDFKTKALFQNIST